MRKKRRIVITGGHLTPALAVMEELVRRGGWGIVFLGRQYTAEDEKTASVEEETVIEKGISFYPIRAARFQRRFTKQTFPSLLRFPVGFCQALWFLARFRPDVILSFGGYVSVPVVVAGWLLGIPSVTHEQTVTLGLANKMNLPFVKKIAFSWPQTMEMFFSPKAVLTGNPLRKDVFEASEKIWRLLNFEAKLPLIFVTGGNQGSHAINKAMEGIVSQLVKGANVFHQCGHLSVMGDFENLEKVREGLSGDLKRRYHVRKYLSASEMGTLLNRADLVISRAGANIITELAALGKPAVLIPIPWSAAGEQTKNAEVLVGVGMAEILPQENLDSVSLLELVGKMITNLDQYKRQVLQAKKLVRLDAAQRVADLVEEAVR